MALCDINIQCDSKDGVFHWEINFKNDHKSSIHEQTIFSEQVLQRLNKALWEIDMAITGRDTAF